MDEDGACAGLHVLDITDLLSSSDSDSEYNDQPSVPLMLRGMVLSQVAAAIFNYIGVSINCQS